jgi:hypothetical protein
LFLGVFSLIFEKSVECVIKDGKMQLIGIFLLAGAVLEVLSIVMMVKLIGGMLTFALMVLSFILGSYLIGRNAGVSKVMLAGALLRGHGRMSLYQMLWPVRIPVAGGLLMIPGFLSSVLALLLLLPLKGGKAQEPQGASPFFTQRQAARDDDVIEGEFVVRSDGGKRHQHQDLLNPPQDKP